MEGSHPVAGEFQAIIKAAVIKQRQIMETSLIMLRVPIYDPLHLS